MNVLVLSDNPEILERAKPIFEKRKINRWTFTDSYSVNPKKDFQHIITYYDLVFSIHCKTIFPKILLERVRCINVHPGFCPFNKGMFPHVWSIVNGLPAGVTIHEMTEEIDGGPCIAQREVLMTNNDTSGTLYKRVIDTEMSLLDFMLDRILANNYKLFNYKEPGNYNSLEDFKDLCNFDDIDELPNITFKDIFAKLRALSHPGYMNAQYEGTKFKLIIDENPNQNHEAHTQRNEL